MRVSIIILCSASVLLSSFSVSTVDGFAAGMPKLAPVSDMLKTYSSSIDELKQKAAQELDGDDVPGNDVFYLRYCLEYEDEEERVSKLKDSLRWRIGEGKSICDVATAAIEKASSSTSDKWDNQPVMDMAPHASIINKYITPSQCITTFSRQGDLVYCIRAGKIDDVSLMNEVTLEQMTEYFLYCKEVLAQVSNAQSIRTDRLVKTITANDLSGVKLIGGSDSFRKALGASSSKASELYPSSAGPTLLLNLPGLLGALVKLFTPLFPAKVQQKLRFEQGPLKKISDLSIVGTSNADAPERTAFLDSLDKLVYSS